ncbi:efflux RND transporter permease subunit [Bryobacter aggregatus]|uniref:efflux RND transporter permease subunit n=1 Tax=Bryobacter aggregatus TaxID=360054 RepID=UPI0004E120D5|nr:efflux RND transporter permease subunit [Bryobacter aggregatus]
MKLVLAALTRPISLLTVIVAIALTAGLALRRMPVDIFPQVGEPAIYVAQPYGGMDPSQMEGFLTYYYEYHFLYITGIQRVESKSIQGAALMKLVFYAGTDMNQAMAQTVGYVNRARAFMPPGAVPPFITRFDAGSVPVGQLVFSSPDLSAGELQDIALNRVRPLFATLPGVSAPPPFGGNQRTIVVRLDPDKLRQYSISPEEAISAVNKATVVVPSGNLRTGDLNRFAVTNSVVGGNLADLANAPVRVGQGTTVYIRDIAVVENGTDILTAYAHVNGKRTVYIPVTKRADASTLAVLDAVKAALPSFREAVPENVTVRLEFDQSGYVTNAIKGLSVEAALGAVLTGLMVLLFLRDWRSAFIVITTIPLALLSAIVLLWAAGQSINMMTLGGLALAVGILVDEATVEVENIHTQMSRGLPRAVAVVEAARRTALPRLLAMVCILAVFVPAVFMEGVSRQLFLPLSLAVGFAMISSYVLSTSLVPVLSAWLMRAGHPEDESRGLFGTLREFYSRYLKVALAFRFPIAIGYLVTSIAALVILVPTLGTELFPQTDPPQFQMRLRAPTGTRIERTELVALKALDVVRQEIGAENIEISTAFIGVQPASYPINTIFLWTNGPHEAVLTVALKPEGRHGSAALRERLRQKIREALPDVAISFEAGDIVNQVLSAGSPTPVEIAIQGPSLADDRAHMAKIREELTKLRFLRDLQLSQPQDYPTLQIDIDRDRAGQYGLTMQDVARSLVAATSSSRFTDPNYWRDPNSGNAFQIQVEIPQNRMQSNEALGQLQISPKGASRPFLSEVAQLKNGTAPGMMERSNGQRMLSLTANLHGVTLGQAAPEIQRAIERAGKAPRGVKVLLRGQVPALQQTISGLKTGLLLTIVVILLFLTANFQSLRLALAIVLTVPAVLCGVVLMLLLTGTTLNIQSFLGAIMAIGIAVANSILLISFSEAARKELKLPVVEAARQGAVGRLRAVLMTASAMVMGMLPMALGLGESGEQSAPLGRAVIGGLILATITTLTIVPALYAVLQSRATTQSPSLNPADPESSHYVPNAI